MKEPGIISQTERSVPGCQTIYRYAWGHRLTPAGWVNFTVIEDVRMDQVARDKIIRRVGNNLADGQIVLLSKLVRDVNL